MKIVFSAILILSLTFGTAWTGYGQHEPERKKVGLVLSGGGAKGSAHIGVLKVLEEAQIPIDYIAGTSMGAIVGGLYAAGYSTRELDSMMRSQNWTTLLMDHIAREDKPITQKEISDTYLISVDMSLRKKFTLPPGVLAGQSVLNLLNEMTIGFHECSFDSLRIPFACVAYDLVEGQQVVFRHGNLPKAIRASMSIPGAFEPVKIDSMLLVDGGIYNNFPVDVVRSMGAEVVIGVDVSAGKQSIEKINTIPGMIDQLTSILARDKYSENLKNVDLYIKPDIIPYTAASFSAEAIDTLLKRGEAAGRAKWNEIVAFKNNCHLADLRENRVDHIRLRDTDTLQIGRIEFMGLTNNEEALIRYRLQLSEHSTITKGQLNNAINRLRGSGAFSYVTYTLNNRPPHTLVVLVNEKQQTNVNLGFRFDSEEMASILLNTTINFRGLQGPSAALTVRLNANPYVKLDLFSNFTRLGRMGLSYMYRHNSYRIYANGNRISSITYGQNRVDLYLLDPNPRRLKLNLGVRYEHLNYSSFLFAPDSDYIIVEPEGFLNYFLFARYETMNDRYFPSGGSRLQANMMIHTDNGLTYNGKVPFFTVSYDFSQAFRVIPGYRRLVAIPSVYGRTIGGGNVAYSYLNFMGGDMAGRFVDHQLPFVGISNMEVFDNSLMVAALDIRMQIYSRNFVYLRGGYAISNDDFFRMFTDRNDTWGFGIKYSYETPLGPISLQVSSSTRDRTLGFYFSLGKTF